jgi:hypothetical protein
MSLGAVLPEAIGVRIFLNKTGIVCMQEDDEDKPGPGVYRREAISWLLRSRSPHCFVCIGPLVNPQIVIFIRSSHSIPDDDDNYSKTDGGISGVRGSIRG